MTSIRVISQLAVWLLFALAAPARATLIPIDLLSAGDALITRDTATGFEWLDLTATDGFSYNQVAAGAGGWTSLGFGIATQAQVDALYRDAGVEGSPSVPSAIAVNRLLALMGCTRGCATPRLGASGLVEIVHPDPNAALEMFIETFPDPTDPSTVVGYGSLIGGAASGFLFRKDDPRPGIGVYLVRVPEPSTLRLFALAALPLALYASALTSLGREIRG